MRTSRFHASRILLNWPRPLYCFIAPLSRPSQLEASLLLLGDLAAFNAARMLWATR